VKIYLIHWISHFRWENIFETSDLSKATREYSFEIVQIHLNFAAKVETWSVVASIKW